MTEAHNLAVKRPLRRFKALGRSFTPMGRKNALRGPEGPPRAFLFTETRAVAFGVTLPL